MIPIHATATANPQQVRWVIAADRLPARGAVREAPGRLGTWLDCGVIDEMVVGASDVLITLRADNSWRDLGDDVREALCDALLDPAGWRVDVAPDNAAKLAEIAGELLSGPIGDHGITILLARGDLDLEADLRSDTRSVFPLVQALVHHAGAGVRWMRDPTRGGVATSLNELARDSAYGIVLFEEKLPVRDSVRGACELLGLDPLHIANEGQFLAIVSSDLAECALEALHATPGGEQAVLIGEVRQQPASAVLVTTLYGGSRLVDMLVGDPLPRIC